MTDAKEGLTEAFIECYPTFQHWKLSQRAESLVISQRELTRESGGGNITQWCLKDKNRNKHKATCWYNTCRHGKRTNKDMQISVLCEGSNIPYARRGNVHCQKRVWDTLQRWMLIKIFYYSVEYDICNVFYSGKATFTNWNRINYIIIECE